MREDTYCVLDIETSSGQFSRIPDGFVLLFVGTKWRSEYSFYEATADGLQSLVYDIHSFRGTVVTFNGQRFDLPILRRSVSDLLGEEVHIARHFDLLATFHKTTGLRASLSDLALYTLGRTKAPWNHRRNLATWRKNPDLLRQHNREDLDLTESLFLRVARGESLFLGKRAIVLPSPQ